MSFRQRAGRVTGFFQTNGPPHELSLSIKSQFHFSACSRGTNARDQVVSAINALTVEGDDYGAQWQASERGGRTGADLYDDRAPANDLTVSASRLRGDVNNGRAESCLTGSAGVNDRRRWKSFDTSVLGVHGRRRRKLGGLNRFGG